MGWNPARYGAGRDEGAPGTGDILGAAGERDEARDRTAYGTGVVGVGATTGVVDLATTVGVVDRGTLGAAIVGVVDRGAAVGVFDLGGVGEGCGTTELTFGNGLFLFPGDRRSLNGTGALIEDEILGARPGDLGVMEGIEALERVRVCAGVDSVDVVARWDAGRRGEGLAGWVFSVRLDTTRNLDPGRWTIPGRGEAAALDEGDEGPGDDGPGAASASADNTDGGRDAGSAGNCVEGEFG